MSLGTPENSAIQKLSIIIIIKDQSLDWGRLFLLVECHTEKPGAMLKQV